MKWVDCKEIDIIKWWTDIDIEEDLAKVICKVLKCNSVLTGLDLGSDLLKKKNKCEKIFKNVCIVNNLSESSLRMISEAIKTNTTLTSLGIHGNKWMKFQTIWEGKIIWYLWIHS